MQQISLDKLKDLDYRANEAYKSLRTNLLFCGKDKKVIMMTSCLPNEGKSSVTMHLCKSLAENGKKVLLIDADLRKSVLVGRYRLGKIILGLSNYLSGQSELDKVICRTDIEGMDIIFAGKVTPNPAELLGGATFSDLIAEKRDEYDYVVIDTPPLGAVIDAAVIATNCDGAVLVIEDGRINRKLAQSVKVQLQKTECPILGVVLNKVKIDKSGYGGKYYGAYYGYYGKYYGEDKD